MTKAQVIALIDQYITTNGNEEITGAQTNSVMKALANQDISFSEIVSKPTTLSGYGITDAYTKGQSDSRFALQSTAINAGTGLTGGGNLTANRTLSINPAYTGFTNYYNKTESDGRYVNVTGDTMTGDLNIINTKIRDNGNNALVISENTSSPTGGNIFLRPGGDTDTSNQLQMNSFTGAVFSGTVTANGFYESSDIRLKKNIEPLNYGLNEVLQLDTHTWNWKKDGSEDMGLIAQELELIMPELVKTNEEGYKSVNYTKLVPVLINAIKELSNGKE